MDGAVASAAISTRPEISVSSWISAARAAESPSLMTECVCSAVVGSQVLSSRPPWIEMPSTKVIASLYSPVATITLSQGSPFAIDAAIPAPTVGSGSTIEPSASAPRELFET
ncbi:hypothetical protein DRQ53_14460 [bacterium]|nr:MAG: hypothetical protein DRQ53_14460 [bacterium]